MPDHEHIWREQGRGSCVACDEPAGSKGPCGGRKAVSHWLDREKGCEVPERVFGTALERAVSKLPVVASLGGG